MKNSFNYLFLIISMTIWGSSFVFTKIVLKQLDPVAVIWVRLVLSLICFYPIILVGYRKYFFLKKSDLKYFLVLAFFEPFLYFLGENFSLVYLSATLVSLIIATIPIVSAVVAFLFLKEKLSGINFFGIFLSAAGIGIIILTGAQNDGTEVHLGGVLLAFLSVMSTVCYAAILKRLIHSYHPLIIISIQNTLGCLYFTPVFLGFSDVPAVFQTLASGSFELWFSLIVLAILASVVAFLFYSIALRSIGVGKSNVFINLIPVVTLFFSFFVLGESLGLAKLLGTTIVIAGLIFAEKKSSQQ